MILLKSEEETMNQIFVATCVTTALLAGTALLPTSAAAQAKTEQVLKVELQGEEGREANIVRFDVEPGWETERHIHPGHVFDYVTEGAIEIAVEGEEPQTVSAGEAIYELPDKPMVGRTASADQGAKFIVFQVGPVGEPLMVSQPQ
jgi:quercetin dioxygenase-like cupin family protein